MSELALQIPLDNLSETHLQDLITNQVPESETLDYKLEMYAQSDAGRRELLRDVSSLANRLGGHLLIGIREEGEIPVEVLGIEDGDTTTERIMSSCLSGISERINGLDVRPVQLSNGRSVIAVYVPPSMRVPHMVIAQQEDRFWIRHGRQKMRMSVAEIRESCLKVENLAERAETFLRQRRERFIADKTRAVQPKDRAYLRIAVTPIETSVDRFDIGREDIRSLMKDPPNMRRDGWVLAWSGEDNPKPMMFGLQIGDPGWRFLEVYRNGYVQLSVLIEIDSHFKSIRQPDGSMAKVLHGLAIVEYTVSVYRFYKVFAEMAGITDPLILSWDLIRGYDWGLCRYHDDRRPSGDYYGPRFWPEQDLILPEIQVPNLSDPDRMAKMMLDRLWQSFGYESAIYFDSQQHFDPPR